MTQEKGNHVRRHAKRRWPPPYQTVVLFQRLGTPEKDKRQVLFDCGHSLLRTHDAVRETLAWLDRYLGPVDIQAATGPTP